jgi:hypothetical protein
MRTGIKAMTRLRVRRSKKAANWTTKTSRNATAACLMLYFDVRAAGPTTNLLIASNFRNISKRLFKDSRYVLGHEHADPHSARAPSQRRELIRPTRRPLR